MAEIEKHLRVAFRAYKRNFIPLASSIILILGVFLLFLLSAAFLMVQNQVVTTPAETQSNNLGPSSDFQALFLINPSDIFLLITFLILVGYLAALYSSSGFVGVCYYGVKKKVYMKTFFKTIRERGVPYFLATLLILSIFLAVLLPFLGWLFILGFEGVISGMVYMLATIALLLILPFLVLYAPAVISGEGVLSSIKQAVSLGRKNYFSLLALVIVFSVLSLVELIPVIGLVVEYFFLFPLLQITFCSIYINEKKSKKGKTKK